MNKQLHSKLKKWRMDANEETQPPVMSKEETESPVDTIPVKSDLSLDILELDCDGVFRSRDKPTVEEQTVCDESLVHNETGKKEYIGEDDLKEDLKTGEESTELGSGSDKNHTEEKEDPLNEGTKMQKKGETQDPTIVPRNTRYFAHDLRGNAA